MFLTRSREVARIGKGDISADYADSRRLLKPVLWVFLRVFASSCVLSPSFAQAPEIGGLLPSGGPRGAATSVRIDGKNLTGAQIFLSGTGIVVKSLSVNPPGDQLTAEFSVSATARLGPYEIR